MRKLEEKLRHGGIEKLIDVLDISLDGRRFRPTRYQKEFMVAALSRAGKIAVVSNTRAGKSTSTAVVGVLMAFLYPLEDVTIVAPTFRQANIIMDKIVSMVQASPVLFKMVKRLRRDLIELENGSRIFTLSAGNPESLLGHGASVLIVDEAASIPDEVWKIRIMRMIMAPRNGLKPVVIAISTPHNKNWFYEAVSSGDWKVFRWTWKDAVDAGIMMREEVERARRILSERDFKVWYEAEFEDPEDVFFNVDDVRKVLVGRVRKDEVGALPGELIFGGLDIARLGDDESALVFIAVPEGASIHDDGVVDVVGQYTLRKKRLSEVIGWAQKHIERWKPVAVGVDVIGMGAGVYDVLRERLGNVVRDVQLTGRTRVEAYGLVRQLLKEGRLVLPRREEWIYQFQSYRVKYTSAGGVKIEKGRGARDDLVDALTLAVWVAASGGRAFTGSVDVAELDFKGYLDALGRAVFRARPF